MNCIYCKKSMLGPGWNHQNRQLHIEKCKKNNNDLKNNQNIQSFMFKKQKATTNLNIICDDTSEYDTNSENEINSDNSFIMINENNSGSDLEDLNDKLNTATIGVTKNKNKRKKPNSTINSTLQTVIDSTVIENKFIKCEGFSFLNDSNESIYTKLPLQLMFFNKEKYNFILENENFHSKNCFTKNYQYMKNNESDKISLDCYNLKFDNN